MEELFESLLKARGLGDSVTRELFLSPKYDDSQHDPFLLPDMRKAVDRIALACKKQESIFIYGDYDIDGLTATVILSEALESLGIVCQTFIPNRFTDGYGLSLQAIEDIAKKGADLIITVDCGSLSHKEIDYANQLGVDVIVTDHHSVADVMPDAVAVINPKRPGHKYPFIDLAGCGVAFKLVQALQTELPGLPKGQEKWLLDLVALGTVCDIVTLLNENRANVFWGLRVLSKTRRPGLRALVSISGVKLKDINARHLGFLLGPRLNAAGRLETAQLSLELLKTNDPNRAVEIAYQLQDMNQKRRAEQDRIEGEANDMALKFKDDPVLVLSDATWSHGIIGIVAARILEKFKKPTFMLQEMGEYSKGSARSYGDFSAVEAIKAANEWLIKGGGHKLAAGVTLKTSHIPNFRRALNDFYRSLKIDNQENYLKPVADLNLDNFACFERKFISLLNQLEPFGHGNPEPVFCLEKAKIVSKKSMGSNGQHIKLGLVDSSGQLFSVVGFNCSDKVNHQVDDIVKIWVTLIENEWRGVCNVEGRLLNIE